ncbi:hypothetical protein FB381_0960 [Nocardioides albertanoniae]|uniref:Uncharacterized protein n=1 Tax=Nocardioides albertanoniae TaxID=1175486 RepID=A0A543A3C7_9ACTN|nr:hypothetical protein [Nocardioides albertanoniae]TQL67088.1 hypothetical protein FB381_0960 [Nocardioides albertanoniae]
MTISTTINEEIERLEEEFTEPPECECSCGDPDNDALPCGEVAAYAVTVLCPEDRCTHTYLLCRECRDQWVQSCPPPHQIRVAPLG